MIQTKQIFVVLISNNWFPLSVIPKVRIQQRIYKCPLIFVEVWVASVRMMEGPHSHGTPDRVKQCGITVSDKLSLKTLSLTHIFL